jgi:hypothetical protein
MPPRCLVPRRGALPLPPFVPFFRCEDTGRRVLWNTQQAGKQISELKIAQGVFVRTRSVFDFAITNPPRTIFKLSRTVISLVRTESTPSITLRTSSQQDPHPDLEKTEAGRTCPSMH